MVQRGRKVNTFETKNKDKSRTSTSSENKFSPSAYIEVNPSSRKESSEYGAILIRFDWSLLEEVLAAMLFKSFAPYDEMTTSSGQTMLKALKESLVRGALSKYLENNKLLERNDVSFLLNKLVNEKLLSVRVSRADKIGSGTANIVLENFDYQWLFQDENVPILFGQPLFQEGLYLTIDAMGRYSSDRFYRIFAGSVWSTNVTDTPTDRKVTIECKDYSKMLSLSRYNIHPAFLESDPALVQGKATIFQTNLVDRDIINLAKEMVPNIKDSKWSNTSDKFNVKAAFREMWDGAKTSQVSSDVFLFAPSHNDFGSNDIMMANFQHSYEISKASYNYDANSYKPYALIWGETDNKGIPFDVYKTMFAFSKLRVSETKSRVDVLNEVSKATFFATYIDGSGNLHFHPYRHDYLYNDGEGSKDYWPIHQIMDGIFLKEQKVTGDLSKEVKILNVETTVKSSGRVEHPGIYKLNTDEVTNETYTQNEEDIVTVLHVYGESDFGIFEGIRNFHPEYFRPVVIWEDGCRMYGYRERKISTPAFGNNEIALQMFAIGAWVRTYLERKKLSVSMVMTPEIEVDRPFYIPYKNMVYHIIGVSHSYSAGTDRGPGEFITTITCNAGRPFDHAKLLITNLFRNIGSVDTLKKIFADKGINLRLETNETQQAKRKANFIRNIKRR